MVLLRQQRHLLALCRVQQKDTRGGWGEGVRGVGEGGGLTMNFARSASC